MAYLYYSAEAAKYSPICIYRDKNGKEFVGTIVDDSKEWIEQHYKWPDKIFVAEVLKDGWVRTTEPESGFYWRV